MFWLTTGQSDFHFSALVSFLRVAIALKLAPLSQPIRNNKKKKQPGLARAIFPALRAGYVCLPQLGPMDCSASFVIGKSNYFGFGLYNCVLSSFKWSVSD